MIPKNYKVLKKIFSCILTFTLVMSMFVMLPQSNTAHADYTAGTYKVTLTSGNLNMRSSASVSSSVVGSIPNGTIIQITSFSNDFGKVTYSGVTGWVSMDYVTFVSSSNDTGNNTSYSSGTYRVTTNDAGGNLNMRSSASNSGSIVTAIPNGTLIVIKTFSNGFGYTSYNGKSGWVSMNYVKYVSSSISTDVDTNTDTGNNTTYKSGTYKVTLSSGRLNMRSSASSSASIVEYVPNGTLLVIKTFSNGFGYTNYNGKSGWVSMDYVKYVSSSTSTDVDTNTDSGNNTTYKSGTYKVTLSSGSLNIRASASSSGTVIGSIPNGTQVVITIFSNGYGYITYNGTSGWVSMDYVKYVSSSTSTDTDNGSEDTYKTGTYKVTTNDAAGNLNIRATASSNGSVIGSIPNGTQIVITKFSNGYGYTTYNGTSGWVSMAYVKYVSSSTSTDTDSSSEGTYKTGTYKVTTNDAGGNLNIRASASSNGSVVGSIPNGTLIVITKFSNGYGYTTYNGTSGWVSMDYVKYVSSSTSDTDNGSEGTYKTGTYKVTTNDAAGNLNIRATASSNGSVIGSIPNGTLIVITKFSNGYGYTTYNGTSGWVSMDYVKYVSSGTSDTDNGNNPTGETYTVKTNDEYGNLNIRSQASSSAPVIGSVPNGTVLTVYRISNGYGYITYGDLSGWVSMDYLVKNASTDTDNQSSDNNTQPSDTDTKPVTPSSVYKVNTKDATGKLNMRYDALSSSEVILQIPNGTALPIFDTRNGFAKTSYNGKSGWVSTEYIALLGPADTKTYKNGLYNVSTTQGAGTLNMRMDPSTDGLIIGSIPNGTELDVSVFYNGYGYVFYDGQSGWVNMDFMSLKSSNNGEISSDTDNNNGEISSDTDNNNGEISSDTDNNNGEISSDTDKNDGEINHDTDDGEINYDTDDDDRNTDSDSKKRVYGDVNCDGKVTMSDVTLFQRIIAGLDKWTSQGKLNADVNGDGKRNLGDVVLIQQKIAKLITAFPVEK